MGLEEPSVNNHVKVLSHSKPQELLLILKVICQILLELFFISKNQF